MRNLKEFITESKETPLYSEWEIKDYFNLCLNKWLQTMSNFSILSLSGYQIIQGCKQCEIILLLIEKFSDDINLHFYSMENEEERKKYYSYTTQEDSIVKVFKIIEQLSKVDIDVDKMNTPQTNIDVEKEVKELKERLETLVKKCNDKYHKYLDDERKTCGEKSVNLSAGCAVPCDCECCSCGY